MVRAIDVENHAMRTGGICMPLIAEPDEAIETGQSLMQSQRIVSAFACVVWPAS